MSWTVNFHQVHFLEMNNFIRPMTLPLHPSLETKKYHQTPTSGPVDRWLTTVSRGLRIDFLKDYLMIGDVVTEHVLCLVELECIEVCTLLFHDLLYYSDAICCYRYLRWIRFLQILPCTP